VRIAKVEDFHADGGWRTFSFLKVTTDDGLVGWSEFNETSWNPGVTAVIRAMGALVVGKDPRPVGRLSAELRAMTRMAPGGLADQAIAAIENACLDIAAKAAGLPVYALLGGPYRDRLRLYWSHCGSFRGRAPELFQKVLGLPPLTSLDDVKALGAEVVARGYTAAKTNPLDFSFDPPRMLNPGFQPQGLDFGQNYDARTINIIVDQLAAFRDGMGPDVGLLLDLNFSQKTEGLMRIAKAVERFNLTWLEMDIHDAAALARVRASTATPIGSLEATYARRGYRPYFEQGAVDVAIVDIPWNGFLEGVKIAALAEAYEVNVAPHNFYGHLATMMSAHFCAAIPNFRIMEIEADDVPWKDELMTVAPVIEDGHLLVPTGPGWGTEINEEAVRAHPAKAPPRA
jgi:L-alanine-DL-glutamate epimerase-like enolase superfamily enzyme